MRENEIDPKRKSNTHYEGEVYRYASQTRQCDLMEVTCLKGRCNPPTAHGEVANEPCQSER